MIGIEHYVVVSSILFVLGVLGIFLNRRNVILMLMAIELILLAVNINLVAFSAFLGDRIGQVFALLVLTVGLRKRRSVLRCWWCISAIAARSRLKTLI